ncbi:MAG: hypothetical protein J6S49_07120 [Erysipelotrichaceae bacterium]|nr:hypothetical protein [Erysipelotrichaceae bacterium]
MFNYPYTNFHEMNLDWIIRVIKNLEKSMNDFVVANRLIFANPLEWDISKNYAMNTFVIDELGNGYLSIRPVPSGVSLTNSSYWMKVFNFGEIITMCNENITANYEKNVAAASKTYAEGEWIMFNDRLYVAAMSILEGTPFYPGVNIIRTNIEDLVKNFLGAMIGALSDLTTDDKTSLVSAINEVNEHVNSVMSAIGTLTDLVTSDKSNIVAAINELAEGLSGAVNTLKTDVYVSDYLSAGLGATEALQTAIDDCPAKGCVIIPRSSELVINDTITISKPIKIKGLSNGMEQLEGGNDETPNSAYVACDLRFTGGLIGFDVLSPSVYFEDLVINVNVPSDFKTFRMSSEIGDQLNMPRDIRITRVYVLNEDLNDYSHETFGVYSDLPCLLSSFTDVTFGWFTYGFVFANATINTSLRFERCAVTAQKTAYKISKGEYCYFIGCSCEAPVTEYAFYLDQCDSVTMIGCFTEQNASAAIYSYLTRGLTVNGFFTTTLPIFSGYLGEAFLCGLRSTESGTVLNPEIVLVGTDVSLSACYVEYVKQGNLVTHQVKNNNVVNNSGTLADLGFTFNDMTVSWSKVTQIGKRVKIAATITCTSTSPQMIVPVPLAPITDEGAAGESYTALIQTSRFIDFTFPEAGTYNVCFDYEAIASF